MAVDIAAEITRNWPETEAKLLAQEAVDYVAQKAAAVRRAKHEAYGTNTIPDDEADIPNTVGYWIADRATVLLIPLAKQYYAIHERLSDAKEGASLNYYNKIQLLDGLRQELETACAEKWEDVQSLVGSLSDEDEIPTISVDGLLVDPATRAYNRDRGWL